MSALDEIYPASAMAAVIRRQLRETRRKYLNSPTMIARLELHLTSAGLDADGQDALAALNDWLLGGCCPRRNRFGNTSVGGNCTPKPTSA